MNKQTSIVWFRQDLRVSDNPALCEGVERGDILPIYILDDENAGEHAMGGAARVWLHHALADLDASLDGKLALYKGRAEDIIQKLTEEYDIQNVFWNRCYEPWRIKRDKSIKQNLSDRDVNVESFNGSLLWEPWTINKDDGTPYKVFTPFYRKGCLNSTPPREPLSKPKNINYFNDQRYAFKLDSLELIPSESWGETIIEDWDINEQGAHDRLQNFIDEGLSDYKEGRNLPAKPYVSRLSPYLRHGQISPHSIWQTVTHIGDDKNIDHFCSELGWREFSYNLLYNNPDLPDTNLQSKFDNFPWQSDDDALKAWQRGNTGVPMVDAGMRELWQTGYLHNRMRMIVGSYLVKNLRLDWRQGERWFWDCLFDADLGNNSAGWQWIAGCGADAAPYFRIFNPVTQGEKFDADGDYVRHYIPELENMPDKYLFSPWEASDDVLAKAGVKLGETYPKPIVDLKQSREAALEAFQSLKESA